ncbi:MAG: type II 3-dehydroquinate dehydratase [Geminicoccaceae bacterium]
MPRLTASFVGLELRFHQSNREYEIIDWIHEARERRRARDQSGGLPTSVAILDALNAYEFPVIEVHISNVHSASYATHSYVSLRADGVIAELGARLRPRPAPAGLLIDSRVARFSRRARTLGLA